MGSVDAGVTGEADAVGRALEATSERLAEILAVQRDISAAGLDLHAVMKLAVDHARRITGADGAMVSLIDGDDMVVRAAGGTAASVLGDRRPLSATLLRFAIESGRPILVPDSRTDPRVNRDLSGRVGDHSIICVPFAVAGNVVGSLNVVSSSPGRPLTEEHRQSMEIVGGMLAAGVGHAAEYESKRSEAEALGRFQTLFDGAPIGIARVALDRHVVAANRALCEMVGYGEEELASSPFDRVTHPEDIERERELFERLADGDAVAYSLEKRFVHRTGKVVWAQVNVAAEHDADGAPVLAIVMVEDITERKAAEEALKEQSEVTRHQATHDELTGLANRVLFSERALEAVRVASRDESGARLAVLVADLDRFKDVNDTLGHHAGDLVLQQVATRVVSALRASDTVARLGGDEFAVLLPAVVGRDGVDALVRRIQSALAPPVLVGDVPIVAGASIGVALYPEDGTEVDVLVQRADTAMYRAKSDGSTHVFYDAVLDSASTDRLTSLSTLRRALDSRSLSLRYGAKARTRSGELCAVVAHPHLGGPDGEPGSPVAVLGPGEHADLARSLALLVVDLALEDCASWRSAGLEVPVVVSVPCTVLADPSVLPELESALATRGLPPRMLELAVPGACGGDLSGARLAMDRLRSIGARVVLDGAGSSSTSLDVLRSLPAQGIRLDASLVEALDREESAAAIVRALVQLARDLGVEVSAHGVARPGVRSRLAEIGCDLADGPAFGDPVPASRVPELVPDRRARATRRRPSRGAAGRVADRGRPRDAGAGRST
ncbi:MAG: diguanylate cyclase [Actinomycetota bacterium]|nr:diguanylate cyclase [Actinomycetota bacterium]